MRAKLQDQGLRARTVLGAICLLAAGSVSAGTQGSAPDGFKAGPWALAPYFETSWERDDNVFRSDDEAGFEPESDEINEFTVGLEASLPFLNSLLGLSYEASQVRYNSHTFTLDTDEEFGANLQLNLNKKDVISVRERYYTGFSDIGKLENSEVVFDGEAFTQNRIDFEVFRSVNREKGYYIRLTHVDHQFNETDSTTNTRSFFNYDGFDGAVEYRQPLPSRKWLLAYWGFRQFDHSAIDEVTGVEELFRQERSQTFQVGLRGLLGKDQPIVFRMGWNRFKYDFPDSSSPGTEATGVATHLDWTLNIGGRSELQLAVDRRVLPSSSDTYYVNSELGAEFQRDILRDSSFSLGVRAGENKYGDPTPDCGGLTRDDKNYRIDADVEFQPHERLAYEIGANYRTRNSNCRAFDYEATEITIGVSMGWF